jgi:hypothetical protein
LISLTDVLMLKFYGVASIKGIYRNAIWLSIPSILIQMRFKHLDLAAETVVQYCNSNRYQPPETDRELAPRNEGTVGSEVLCGHEEASQW